MLRRQTGNRQLPLVEDALGPGVTAITDPSGAKYEVRVLAFARWGCCNMPG